MPTRRICPKCRKPTFAVGPICRSCRSELAPDDAVASAFVEAPSTTFGRHLAVEGAPGAPIARARRTAVSERERAEYTRSRRASPGDSPGDEGPRRRRRAADGKRTSRPRRRGIFDLAPLDDEAARSADETGTRHSELFERLELQWRANALFIASVVVASIAWGVAVGVLTASLAPKPLAAGGAPVSTALLAGTFTKIHDRDREIAALRARNADLRDQIAALRKAADESAVRTDQSLSALNARVDALDAQARSAAALRAQIAALQSDNAGLEQNYNHVLEALHRTQARAFSDERRLAAVFAAQKEANDR